MADEQDGSPAARDFTELAQAFFLELGVADGEDFINDENFRIEVRRHRESETDIHAAGVALHGGVEEFFNTGEIDDGVKALLDFPAGHAENGAIEEDVFAAVEFGVEAGPDFQKA